MKLAITVLLLPAALALPGYRGPLYKTGYRPHKSGYGPSGVASGTVAPPYALPTTNTSTTPPAAEAASSTSPLPLISFITIENTVAEIIFTLPTPVAEGATAPSEANPAPNEVATAAAGAGGSCAAPTTTTVDVTVTVTATATATATSGQAPAAEAADSEAVSPTTSGPSPVQLLGATDTPNTVLASSPGSVTAAQAVAAAHTKASGTPKKGSSSGSVTAIQAVAVSPTKASGTSKKGSSSGSVTAVKAAAAAPTKASSTPKTGSSSGSGNKRGLITPCGSADADLLVEAFNDKPSIKWNGNYYSTPPGNLSSNIDFVPQDYHFDDADFATWNQNAKQAISEGQKYLLGFGEPETDPGAQSPQGVQAAAEGWMKFMQPYSGQASLGSPAVLQNTNDFNWLSEFLDACDSLGCDIGFIAIHWMWEASQVESFKTAITNATTIANGKPVWVDNFSASGTNEEQQAFLNEVVPWMEANDAIERYAYVSPDRTTGTGFLNADGSISSLGTFYANL